MTTLEIDLSRDCLQLEDVVVLDERVLQPVDVRQLVALLVNCVEVRVANGREDLRGPVLVAW